VRRPNIVLILVDDMGYGDFGILNDGLTRTPTLDHLADQSICFTQHYSASCVCAPARASLLTGRYPHRTGAIDTLEGRGLDRLALSEVTLADVLKKTGYATGLIGKWHLGALDPRYHPNSRGFDEFIGFRGGWQDYYEWRLDVNGSFRKTDGTYLTDVFTEEAVRFVARHRNEPFFLHVTYNAPHFPLQVPEEDASPFLESGRFNWGVSTLYGMLLRMDKGVERILAALDEHGLTDNTIVIFTSDNGPQFGGQGERCTTRFNCHYHGAKGSVYEGGIRVPLLLRWPAGLEHTASYDRLVHFTDWFPTLLAMAGIEIPSDVNLDGHNILPTLRGEVPDIPPRRFWQWNRYTPLITSNAAMRDGDWKLVRPRIAETMWVSRQDLTMDRALKYEPERYDDIRRDPEPERQVPEPPPPELYNIAKDPLEQHDLAAQEEARVRRMLSDLETWFAQVDAERRAISD